MAAFLATPGSTLSPDRAVPESKAELALKFPLDLPTPANLGEFNLNAAESHELPQLTSASARHRQPQGTRTESERQSVIGLYLQIGF